MPTAAVQFEKVSYRVNGLHILNAITGSFYKGEITSLVGPSGAGKTTLFQLCNALKSPTSGEIFIHGDTITNYPPIELRREVGIALQDATMLTGSIRENLALPRTLQGKELPKREAEELMTVVGLDKSYLNRSSKELSGGQRQKLSIARTLVNQPKILLLDEITSSLDRISQQDIEALIMHINKKYGTTIIWITHNLEQAINISTYTWVLMDGQLIESGKSSLLNDTTNEHILRFVRRETI